MFSQRSFKLLLFTFILACTSSIAQDQKWEWVNPSPHNNKLFSIFFLNPNTGWSAGESGTIMKTVDGGSTWTVQNYGRDSIHSIIFINEMRGWAVGNNGTCMYTTDGGEHWEFQNTNTNKNITTVFFINTNTGWIAGQDGLLMHTINGGQNWTAQNFPSFSDVSALSFINDQDGWASTSTGIILHTSNGGLTWHSIANANVDKINDIQFIDEKNAWAVGKNNFKGIVLRSINGGITWKKLFIVDNSPELNALHFYSNEAGWVSGELGLFMKTENIGLSWEQYFFEGNGKDIFAFESGDIWITNGPGNIRTSHNEGMDWDNNTKGFLEDLKSIYSKDDNHIWALVENSNKLYISDNAGLSWNESFSLLQENKACYFLDANTGLVVGENGSISRMMNKDWTHILSPVNNTLNQIKFWNNQTGWIVGDNGTILKSTDKGLSWSAINSPTSSDLLDLYILGERDIWIAGKNGTLFHSYDAGMTWTQIPLELNENILCIEFINNKYGWISGENGLIYATQNAGIDWTAQMLPDNLHETITNIVFTSRTKGYCIAKNSNKIYTTIDGGENWTISYGLVNVKARPYTFLGKSESKTLFVAGKEGTIGKLENEYPDIVGSTNQINVKNHLIQCFPSPTSGKVNIQLKNNARVLNLKIVVHNLVGKQILQKPFHRQSHTELDLENCADGLYMLSIINDRSGEVIANKKIVLEK